MHPRAHPPMPVMAAVVVVASLAAALAACGSSPTLPSAGTQTGTPAASLAATASESATARDSTGPGVSPSNDTTTSPEPSPAAEPTPITTMPPAAAIAAELVTPGSLTMCVALLGAPAASLDNNNKPDGYNIAFANEIAFRLGLNAVIQVDDFADLISKVESHECDVTISSQNITSARTSLVNLIPYTQAKSGFPVVVAFGNPRGITEPTNMCGKQVSVAAGSTLADAVNEVSTANCATNGADSVHLRSYPTELDAVQALLDMSVDAYVGNSNFVGQYPDLIEDAPLTLPPAQQGIGVALDHPALTAAVRAALGAMISDGRYLQILRQYVSANSLENFSIVDVT